MSKTVEVNAKDLSDLIKLTRELAREVRELEGETSSAMDAQQYIDQLIARIESKVESCSELSKSAS